MRDYGRTAETGVFAGKADHCKITDRQTMITYSSPFLIRQVVKMAQSVDEFAIVLDFTHDMTKEKFKIGTIALVCFHWDESRKRNAQTVVPFAFILADEERGEAHDLLFLFADCAIEGITGFHIRRWLLS